MVFACDNRPANGNCDQEGKNELDSHVVHGFGQLENLLPTQ
jgi:hypothetical protein